MRLRGEESTRATWRAKSGAARSSRACSKRWHKAGLLSAGLFRFEPTGNWTAPRSVS